MSLTVNVNTISTIALEHALKLRDLSDEKQGPHAMQEILREIHEALATRWKCGRMVMRPNPIVTVEENYDDLGYPIEGLARSSRYTRYISDSVMLRTQTSAAIPGLLRSLALCPPEDLLVILPGLAYRRDVIDAIHVGEPHQLDLWRLKKGTLNRDDLLEMIDCIVDTVLPRRKHRVIETLHPYTVGGLQVDVLENDEWIEIGECGLACPNLISRSGMDSTKISGLAMGVGLDRLLMIRKKIPDIRLLRSDDPRVVSQMLDLKAYRPVSNQPSIERDISVAVAGDMQPEEVGDKVREALSADIDLLEELGIVSETHECDLPSSARERMGIRPGQKNLLIRLVIRHPVKTLKQSEANAIRDRVYLAIHSGHKLELAGPPLET